MPGCVRRLEASWDPGGARCVPGRTLTVPDGQTARDAGLPSWDTSRQFPAANASGSTRPAGRMRSAVVSFSSGWPPLAERATLRCAWRSTVSRCLHLVASGRLLARPLAASG